MPDRSFRVSIVLEEYNEEHAALASHDSAIDCLLRQEFPLDEVELVLTGREGHIDEHVPPEWSRFGRVVRVSLHESESHYWQQKNAGRDASTGAIVAWLDSDMTPEPTWLAAIAESIEGGADVSVGPSLFRHPRFSAHSPLMLAAASVSWGFVLARCPEPTPCALLAHNVAMRRSVAVSFPFPTGDRSYQSTLLYYDLRDAGARIVYTPLQRAAHAMTFAWWIKTRHFRTGYETYDARQDSRFPRPPFPHGRVLRWAEPPVLRSAVAVRDLPHWFRFRRVVGTSRLGAIATVPLVGAMSVIARVSETAGMYASLLGRTPRSARF